ncbi:MAG: SNF2-related protein [Caldilineaceae bacterium]
MKLTNYHAKYFAYEITKRHSADELEKLTGALVDAQVDLNPHQVDAALFAFRSPLSKGAILADEVGLGKTIEAGLIISQRWAERKRRILIITPANLRKQWLQELQEKFFVPCRILETKSFNQAVKEGNSNPFDADEIVICSYHFARNKSREVGKVPWNLVVIDEAHRLRNVYKRSNKIANELRDILVGSHKLLLTATPLQNSLLELYGLVSFIDEHLFGDLKSFREQFTDVSNPRIFQRLKERISPVCQRTLRSQVLPYIRYTERHPILEKFTPTQDEETLYELVSDYLRKPQLLALPTGQRQLITLVLRKLLASSTYAIAGALEKMANRLQKQLDESMGMTTATSSSGDETFIDELDDDFEHLDEIEDEWESEDDGPTTTAEQQALNEEISELRAFYELAISIEQNAKGTALLQALDTAFAQADALGAKRKALIFTESRRTQEYLVNLLTQTSYGDGIVLFNGSNNDDKSKAIYEAWKEQYETTDRFTGSRTADMRSALVDYFRNEGTVMIATEAGAEGINLQFCSLVVNYDLPWNPQRIEQRIGRCHRYGQQHDVVVVNFLNQKNAADQRVFELLDEKFQLFNGVFGASDEVLGAVESGVAFEKRIAEIYQTCRTPEEINAEFDRLQQELSAQIEEAMTRARQNLLENFDDVVKEKLRIRDQESKAYLNRYERMLMAVTQHELNGHADFVSDAAFVLKANPFPTNGFATGLYELPRRSGEAHFYRLAHPLAQQVLAQAKARQLPNAELHFDYRNAPNKITILEDLPTKQGWLQLSLLTVQALEQTEDRLIWSGLCDDGHPLDEELLARLFSLPAQVTGEASDGPAELRTYTAAQEAQRLQEISERNANFFEEEIAKLEAWADDRKVALEREIKEFDRRIKEARRVALAAPTLDEKLAAQKEVKAIEKERSTRRRALFEAQDEIDEQRDRIIGQTEGQLAQTNSLTHLFTVRWSVS